MGNLCGFKKEEKKYFLKNIFQKKFRISKVVLNLFAVLTVNSSDAQIIKWDFDEGSGNDMPFQNVIKVSASSLIQMNNNGTTSLISSSSSSSGYTGSSGNYNAAAAAISDGFNPATSTYFEFTLTPDQGYSLTVNQINFGSRSTSTGPHSYSIRSSIDLYNSEIAANSFPYDSKWYFYQHPGLSVLSNSSITIRIYGFNGIGASSNVAVWRIDDLSIDVKVTPVQSSYRSFKNGNWTTPSTWEYSSDNVLWNTSTNSPSKDEENILIQSGHTVIINSPVSLDQTTVEGKLELQTGGILNINDGAGDDIIIKENGVLRIVTSDNYSKTILQSSGATINISTNGKIEIGDGSSFTGDGYEGFATSTENIWNDGAVFEYNRNKPFNAPGLTYFPNVASNVIPIFRVITVSGTPGVGSSSDFRVNGILEVNTDLTFSGTGKKYFRNGIKGTATLTQSGNGKIYLVNENALLGGASLKLVLLSVMDLAPKTIIPAAANVTISGSNLNNSSGTLTINGTLDLMENTITNSSGLVILNGTFRTSHTGGFSGSKSSIPSTTGNIIVNSRSTIELYGKVDQSINARTDFSNLIFSGSGIKIPKGPFSPNGTITIKDDAIFDCSGNVNGINIGNENTNLTMTGNSRLIVSGNGPNPPIDGIYNLSGGVIEFKCSGSTPQNIKNKSYQNIEVTGTNVGMSEGKINLNSNGTFTVKTGGIFWINDNTIAGSGDHSEIIKVESGATFKCGTNMGFNGAAITSAPIKSSAINVDIEKIILEPNSTVEYSRAGDQLITNAGGLVYQNFLISGSGNKTAPSDELVILGNFSKTSTATFLHNSGTVSFKGNNPQTYTCVSPQMIFNNLTNENKAGLTINDGLSIYNMLLLKDNSILNLNAKVVFLSSKENTASIGQLSTNVILNDVIGNCIVERYINTDYEHGGHKKSWQFLSTPAFGPTIFDTWQEKGNTTISGYGTWITDKSGITNGFDASSLAPSMKYFEPVSNKWNGIESTHIILQNEKGYMIFVRGDRQSTSVNSAATPTVLRTEGKLYTPQFPPPISIVPAGRFQSVGNPYASAIDFSRITSSNIQSSYTAWDPTLGGDYGVGGYQTISAATGYKAVPGHSTNYTTTGDYRYIQSGQAFFVFNHTASEGSVSFSEDCKVSGYHHLATRKAELTNGILFANLISKNEVVIDGNAVSFSTKFSNEIDGDDALKISSGGENFALKRSGKILTIEAREEIKESDTIFYNLKNLAKQEYKIVFVPQKIQSGFDAYLVDQYLKTEKQITFAGTSIITFSVTEEKASSDPGRFFMIFRAAVGSSAVPTFSMNASPKDGSVIITWHVENENKVKDYELEYSIDGIHFSKIGVVYSGNFADKYLFVHEKPNAGIGFYRIRINKITGESEYKKVVKVIIPWNFAGIQIYPNPIHQGCINLQFVKQPLGKYSFHIYNAVGQKMLSEELIYKGEVGLSLKTIKNFNAGIYQLEIIKPNGERVALKIGSL